jgi:hypothetical protein
MSRHFLDYFSSFTPSKRDGHAMALLHFNADQQKANLPSFYHDFRTDLPRLGATLSLEIRWSGDVLRTDNRKRGTSV